MLIAHSGTIAKIKSAVVSGSALLFDFTQGTLPSGVTASGGTNGTVLNSSGVIVSQSDPRFMHSVSTPALTTGIAVEPYNRNGTQYDLDNNWGGGGTGNTPYADPFGGTMARSMSLNQQYSYYTFPDYPAGLVEMSCFFKPVSPSTGSTFMIGDDRSPNEVTVDLKSLTPSITSTNNTITNINVTPYPNGFYRLSFVCQPNTSNTSMVLVSNGTGTGSVLICYPQIVAYQGGISTPIVGSVSADVQRTGDVVTVSLASAMASLTFTFDDNSTQSINNIPAGNFILPASLKRTVIKNISGVAASGTPAWNPLNLGSILTAWWDPTFGLNLDSNNNVISWADRQGGFIAGQYTVGVQPTYSSTARNGTPGLIFNGSQYLTSGGGYGLPSLDFTMAVSFYGTTISSQTYIVGWGSSGQNQSRAFAKLSDNNLYFDAGSGAGFGDVAPALSGDNFSLVEYASSTPNAQYYQDGTLITSSTPTLKSIGFAGLGIGYWPAYGSSYTGTIQQIVICNASLTTSQRQKLEGWESWVDGKNGSNLPSNHPYKSRAPLTTDP